MKKAILLTVTSTLMTVGIPQVLAQTNIGDLQRNSGMTISGTIKSVVGNEFILDDGTGQVIVDTAPRWWQKFNFNAGERVTVVGEYDDEDFDAFKITRSDGSVINIRNGLGRPPWAGGNPQGGSRPD
ncbi:NirD/YgiW/YdeI family stress tolerance protein [Plectonema cf. radiosum LEGE 06105]|uniref:NirD/YgiW/YdeI family stress tolerance protein n=1 Tax=Plectonema cf. radiosum LEGE 06105 TaxID=945769 RepID=A0A8J7F6E1_9CYAN|nr:NirD/YgiW/YdeI family stress tolerance protein [Plectonema radiosum]MBE9215433.1 NirD/YgiW/YdeI family stress tolerance protein [Plectonema cf. radiosum LEGE 06105]